MNKLVSVILPVYNTEKTLDRTIESVINQTYTNLEIILIDDGSSDGSGLKCDTWCRREDRIKCIHKTNEGLGITRNVGIGVSKGDYILFVDTDDYIERKMIEEMIVAAENSNADIVSTTFIIEDKEEKNDIVCGLHTDVQSYLLTRLFGRINTNEDDFFNVSSCTKMYSRKFIKENNLLFKSERKFIWEDMEYNARCLLYAKRVFVFDKSFYHYCYNENSTTHIYDATKFDKINVMFDYFKEFISENKIPDEAYNRLCFSVMGNVRMCIKQTVHYCNIKKSLGEIKRICNSAMTNEIIKSLKNSKLSKQQKILNLFLYNKNVFPIYILARLQNIRTKGVIN